MYVATLIQRVRTTNRVKCFFFFLNSMLTWISGPSSTAVKTVRLVGECQRGDGPTRD